MKIVVGIPNDSYETLKMLSERPMFWLDFYQRLIVNGTPLPEGAEILTKEAYSDLCLRASEALEERESAVMVIEILSAHRHGRRTIHRC